MGSFMRRVALAVPLLALGAAGLRADDKTDPVAAQKKAAEANWRLLEVGEPVQHETAHLLLIAPKSFERRLREWGALLEKHYDVARKALQVEKDDKWWSGKMTVYLLAEREHFTNFVRRVEKRRLDADEAGSYMLEGDQPHVAASPPRRKLDPPVEFQAGEQLASALLHQKAGPKVPVADWVVLGFGRATYYRVVPSAAGKERAEAVKWARSRYARDVWGTLDVNEAVVLGASLADFLAYGSSTSKFAAFLKGFEPEENVEKKTTEQALSAAGIKVDTLDKAWKVWLTRQR